MNTIHLIDALPGSGKTRNEVAHIIASNHNRFLYTCKGINQIDALVKDFAGTDVVVTPFKSGEEAGSIVERIEKFVRSLNKSDTRKHVVVITHKAFDMFRSVKFFEEAGFVQSYDEKPEHVTDLSVAYDSLSNPEAIRSLNEDGTVSLSENAIFMLASQYKFRNQSQATNDLVYYITHPRYEVRLVTDKEVQDSLVEYYQAYIKSDYFLSDTRILSYGVIGSSFHQYAELHFDAEITGEDIVYAHRDHTITVVPMTQQNNSTYIQTTPKHKDEFVRMMHKMYEMAIAKGGKAMSYTNKVHDGVAKVYESKGVTHLPNYLHGLNQYTDHNVLVTTFVSNRSPEAVLGLTKLIPMSKEEALVERSRETLIQVVQRGVTRDYNTTGKNMTVYVVSVAEAEHIAQKLPNVTIDLSVVTSGEFTFKDIERSIPLTDSDRKKIKLIKRNLETFPRNIQILLNEYIDFKGTKFKELLVKAGLWNKFNTVGKLV